MVYNLSRSRRKTASLRVRDGEVEVRAPLRMPKREIDRFVMDNADWITQRLTVALKKKEFAPDYGSKLLFRGAEHEISRESGAVFHVPAGADIKAACVRIYKALAKPHIAGRAAFFAERMRVEPSAVKINSAMKRWGSCSSRGSLNFSWRIMMADDAVIDYVVVHELAHLVEMNHSPRFWAVVAGVLPDYSKRRARLRLLNKKLEGEDWT